MKNPGTGKYAASLTCTLLLAGMACVALGTFFYFYRVKPAATAGVLNNIDWGWELSYHLPYVLISMGAFSCLFSLVLRKIDFSGYERPDVWLLSLIFITLLFYSISSQIRFLDNDEYEHLHNAWMMKEHTIPFFSLHFKHSPLLEWITVFFMSLQNPSTLIIRTMRLFIFLLSCGSLCVIYLIARNVFNSYRTALVSVWIVLCNFVWMEKSPEIRPDNLMVFFCLLALLALIRFHETQRSRYIFLFVLGSLLSFLGKQNAAIFIFSIGLVVFRHVLGSLRTRRFGIILITTGITITALAVLMIPHDIILDIGFKHLIPNDNKFWPTRFLYKILEKNPEIFLLFVAQIFLFKKIKTSHPIFKEYILSVSIVALAFLFLMNRPWMQEMIVMTVFMTLLAADALSRLFRKTGVIICTLILLAMAIPANRRLIKKYIVKKTMTRDLITTETILKISGKNDLVFDSYGKPIFRHHPLEPRYLMYFPEKFSRLELLEKSRTKFLIKDSYYPRLPQKTIHWFENNFRKTKKDPNIYVRDMAGRK